jgi:hypothetical protein
MSKAGASSRRKYLHDHGGTLYRRYRKRGRELKHRGDQRRKEASTNKHLSTSPEKEMFLASLEQTDAILLYMYGFWCEDMASNGSCIVANWTSLYGLLKYVYSYHESKKMTFLAGLW